MEDGSSGGGRERGGIEGAIVECMSDKKLFFPRWLGLLKNDIIEREPWTAKIFPNENRTTYIVVYLCVQMMQNAFKIKYTRI